MISGYLIVKFAEAAEKYSGYDVADIKKELERKLNWYYEHNPEEAARSKTI